MPIAGAILAVIGVIGMVAVGGCGDSGRRIAVSLRTDLRPGGEFDAVHVEFSDGTRLAVAASPSADYLEGVRLIEEATTSFGETELLVQLTRGGMVVIERRVSVFVEASLTIATVVITRDCRGVMCPAAGSPLLESCLGGECADPRCTRETPEFCPAAECAGDAECPAAVDCVAARCVDGLCFAAPDDALCVDGFECDASRGCVAVRVDAGMDAGMDAGTDAGADAGTDAGAGDCFDGAQNGEESGVDCGGPCPVCNACPSIPNAWFCSDFSDGALSDWDVTEVQGSAQLEVSEAGALNGTSLLLSAEAGEDAYVERVLPAVLTGSIYARFYLYVEPGDLDALRPVFEFASESSVLRFAVSANSEGFWVYANARRNGGGPTARPGQWQCVRYEVDIGDAGEHRFGVDNGSTRFPPLDTRPGVRGYNRVRLGMLAGDGTVRANMRIDDFAIGSAPIPCL